MYRDDQEALRYRLDGVSREAEQLRKENQAMRAAVGNLAVEVPSSTLALPAGAVYSVVDVRSLALAERARLAQHSLQRFPVWLVGLLNLVTFGVFPLIHFGLMHDKLPRAAHDDPSAAKAIGFQFIPGFSLYWIFFNSLRLCDRLTLQLRLRDRYAAAPRGIVLAACIVTVIPYVNVFMPILWTIAVCLLQSTVNEVAELKRSEWDATVDSTTPEPAAVPLLMQSSPGLLAQQARARKLVNWSHALGWGGLGMLIVTTPVVAGVMGAASAGVVGGLSGISVIVGAVIGQVGRGMQGRAI
jgi:hypothetical protein